MAISRDGQLVASGGDDGAVRVWQANQDQPIAVLQGHSGAIFSVAISEDTRNIVSGSLDGTARIWSNGTGNAVAVLDARTGPVWAIAISRDSRLLASGGVAGVITLWDVPTQSAHGMLRGHASGIWGLALSSDGQLLASASFDATARLWDTRSGECLGVLEGHTGGVWSTALSDDGRLMATAGFDGIIRLWDPHTLQELDSLRSYTGLPLQHGPYRAGGIWSIAFDEHAHVLASAGVNRTIVIWDLEHAAILRRLKRDRIYERLDITSLTGVTDAQRGALLRLGAVDAKHERLPSSTQRSEALTSRGISLNPRIAIGRIQVRRRQIRKTLRARIRDEIAASWQRSALAGLRPERYVVPYRADIDDAGRLAWARHRSSLSSRLISKAPHRNHPDR